LLISLFKFDIVFFLHIDISFTRYATTKITIEIYWKTIQQDKAVETNM